MSSSRNKNLNRVNVAKDLKNLDIKDELSHIPVTLYKFPSAKSPSGLPSYPFRPNISGTLSPQAKEPFPNVIGSKPHLTEIFKPDTFNKTIVANQILKSDKELNKIDFSKKSIDVSYLMETKPYVNEQKLNDHSANIVKKSLDLLSPKNQMGLTEYSILSSSQYREDRMASRREKGNIYLEMKEYGKEEPLTEALEKVRSYCLTEESPDKKTSFNKSVDIGNTSFSKNLPKIVDPSKFESAFDLPDSPNIGGMKNNFMLKNRKGFIVQKRAQNKNLLVPSGRKEVISLSDWLSTMLEDIQKNNALGLAGLLDQTQSIYTVCLEEIIRQVKIQCSERGQLLEKIWEAYMSLFNMAVEVSQKEKKQIESLHQDQIVKLKLKHDEEIAVHLQKTEKIRQEQAEISSFLEKETELKTLLEVKSDRLTKELAHTKRELRRAQEEIDLLKISQEAGIVPPIEKKSLLANKPKRKTKFKGKGKVNPLIKLDDEDITLTDEDISESGSSYQEPSNNTEELVAEEELAPFKDAEVDTADLEQYIQEGQNINEKLDKSIQWEDQIIETVEGVEGHEQGDNQQENQGQEEAILADHEIQQEENKENSVQRSRLESENKTEVSRGLEESEGNEENEESELSEVETQGLQSVQEIVVVQHLEEMKTVKEALDRLTGDELQEIEQEIRARCEHLREKETLESKEAKNLASENGENSKKASKKKKQKRAEQSKLLDSKNVSKTAIKETTKEDVIEVLEKYQEAHVYPTLKDIPTEDEMIQFMVQFLKGDEEWKLEDFKHLINKITKRKACSLELDDQEEPIKNDAEPSMSLKSLTGERLTEAIKSMEQENLLAIITELEKKLEMILNGGENTAESQEVIHMLQAILREREDILQGSKYKSLFQKILQAYDNSVQQNMELKIENKEQDIDLKDLTEQQARNENKQRDLYKQINNWQEKNKQLEKENKKLAKTLIRTKTLTQENDSQKAHKPTLIFHDGPSASEFDGRDDFEDTPEAKKNSGKVKVESIENTMQADIGGQRGSGIDNQRETDVNGQREVARDSALLMPDKNDVHETQKVSNSDLEEDEWSESENRSEKHTEGDERRMPRPSMRTRSFFSGQRKPKNAMSLTKPVDGLKTRRIIRVTSVNGENANALLLKAKEKKNVKSALTKASLLKFISQSYVERLKDAKKWSQVPLHISVYESFMNKYGLKKVAEAKCLQIYESAMAFSANCKKIHRFKDLLGLGDSVELVEELELYLATFKQLDTQTNGTIIASNTQERIFVGMEQAEAAILGIFESKLDPQNLKELLLNLQNIKSFDKVSRAVELEDIIDQLFYVQGHLQDTVKGFVKEIFNATDLDNDETIEFFEFNILYKQLEKERYDKKQVKDLFFENADLVLSDGSNEPVLSFNKFAWLCLEMKLFSEEKQKAFAKVLDPSESVQNVRDLEQGIKQKLNEIRLRFMKSQTYTPQVKGIMTKLYNSVKNPVKPRNIVWLSFRLLDEESKSQLLEYEMRMMLPREFNIIQRFVDELEGWVDNHYVD